MHLFRKLVRNGNAAQISIPRAFLSHLGWTLGDTMVVELLEDNTIWLRQPTARDWQQRAHGLANSMPQATVNR